jgi:hypothetical protein
VETVDGERPISESSERPAYLRLVWSNPHPPIPRHPVDLAVAIERHLTGRYGMTDEEFARLFARASAGKVCRVL